MPPSNPLPTNYHTRLLTAAEHMTRSRVAGVGVGEDEEGGQGGGGGGGATASAGREGGGGGGENNNADSVSGGARPAGAGEIQPLSRAKRLHQQSIMSFWLILKKKNDFQAKAARVQELRAMLEKIRRVCSGRGAAGGGGIPLCRQMLNLFSLGKLTDCKDLGYIMSRGTCSQKPLVFHV